MPPIEDISAPVTPEEVQDLLRAIRLTRPDGEFYREREKKYHEVIHFITHILVLERTFKKRKELVLLDCGCGRSYLSFVLNMVLTEKLERPAYFIGVDTQSQLIETCRTEQGVLGYENMEFHRDEIIHFQPSKTPDIVYSLHACDMATDEAIAKGIQLNARCIIVAPCCQRQVKGDIRGGHPLRGLSKHSVFKEIMCVMLTDGSRTLALEAAGYRVTVIEFVPAKYTPKNIMLRAERVSFGRKREAVEAYRQLSSTFRFRAAIERYLPDIFSEARRCI